jgi:DnaK suppressor protein
MNEKQRNKVRERLLEERSSRLEALAEFDERFRERLETGDDDLTNYPLHMADEGTDTMEKEKEFLLASTEGRQLLEIDDALRRLYDEDDSFGTCERCGEEISMERLEIVPWARLCARCQREEESDGSDGGESAA